MLQGGGVLNDLPERISRYRVRSVLGVGGFGVVVCAHDELLDAQVAVKVLSPEHAQDPLVRERFVREAQLLRRVHSTHVIAVHDIGELDDGRPYMVMELATGGVLGKRIAAGVPADASGVRATIMALASGLGALHGAGIVHRDVTPGNLLVVDDSPATGDGTATVQRHGLLAESERVVVADLGLAKDQERTVAGPTIVGGTPHFRSPEQTRRGEEIGPAADVYGATGVLWNLLTGEAPAADGTLEAQLATVPTAWRYVFERGLALAPSERFSSMAEWEAAALEALDHDSGARDIGFRAAAAGATCPYKGLTSFQPQDSAFFFGREALVDELVARLQSSSTLVIGGPSGSGKSSLLRAGLVHAIASGALPGSQHWPVLLFSPGSEPLDELALQLSRLTPDGAAPGADELRLDARAVRRWLPPGAAGLLAIDQFEEIFTHGNDPAEVRAVLEVLDALTSSQDSQVRVVIALRSDFYSTCAGYPRLADRISDNQVLVGPMRRQELRRAVEGPAQRAGLRLEPGLTEAILDEAGEEPGGLPLIAHALMETWMRRRGTVLTLDGFHAAGGVIGAIAQSAEHAYERLDEPARIATRRLFLRLVTPGDDAPDTKRRLSWEDLGADAETSELVERLAADRLLTVDERGVELVHETLIRSWPRLRAWIDESREDLRVQQRIARAANEWNAADRDPDLLYRGAPLAAVLAWQESADVELAAAPAAFVDASRAARDAEELAASAAAHRQRRVRRFAFGALSVLAAAAIAASVLAFVALRQSQHNEAKADNRFARGLATQAESLAPTRPKLALALAVESAARVDPIPAEAQQAMATAREALARSDIVASSEPIPVGDALTTLVTPDGSTMVTGARDGTVRLWDTRTRETTGTLTGPSEGVEELAIDPEGRWLVAVGNDGLWRWDLDSDTTEGELIDRPTGALWSAAFSADGARVATAAENGVVTIYSTSSWKPDGDPLRANVDFLSVAFTLDGKRLLAGTGDGRVFIWDVADRSLVGSPIAAHGTNDVWELVMDPSGERVATASSDGTASVWSLASGALVATPFVTAEGDRTLDAVAGLVWSHDGGSLFAGGSDGRVHEWELASQSEVDISAIGHDDRVIDAFASADRTVLATLGRDQDVRLWDTADREPTFAILRQLNVPLYGVAVSEDSTRIAVGDDRGVVHVLSSDGPAIPLGDHAGPVFGLAFLPAGGLLSGDDAGSLRLWDPASGQLLAENEQASPGGITSIAVAPAGDLIATSSADGAIRLWTPDDLAEPVALTPAQTVPATKVVFTGSGELVASYGDGQVRFWNRDGSEARSPLMVDDDHDAVFSVAVSPDQRLLAVATATDGVTIWDLDTDRQSSQLNGQPIDAIDVAFTPDGTALVSATRRGVITLWNSVAGQAIGPRFQHHTDAVWRLAVTPSSAVISASEDGTVSRLDSLDLGRACQLGAPALDRRARDRYLGDREPIACQN
jgi:WD40 repeat protein/tRNA A-37 threonylcarbamoyl transferase component Bud32